MTSNHASRSQLFRDALVDAVAGTTADDTDPAQSLVALVARCRAASLDHDTVLGALDAFDAIVARGALDDALSEAAALFESPQRFREALFFLRCLDRDADTALDLMHAHAYLSGAVMPSSVSSDLAREQASLLDAATFEATWQNPEQLRAMLSAIQAWRSGYTPIYAAAHAESVLHTAALISDVEAARWQVDTLEKLNLLHRIGEPVAVAALLRFHDVASAFACGNDPATISADLQDAPTCGRCAYRLGDRGGIDDLNAALVDIERGLATQRTRLAQRVVRRLTARQGWAQDQRLRLLVDAIETDNMPVLARVLDEGMIDFLGDVLEAPEPRINLIDRLAETHPVVTNDSMEAVVAAFRALVSEELRRSGGRVLIGREEQP